MRVEKPYMGKCINVMTQVLWTRDSSLLQGFTIQNAYTELRQGSKNAVMVVRNRMAYSQTLKKTLVARTVATTIVSEPPPGTSLWAGEDGQHNPHTPKLTVRQRHEKLFEELDLSGLDWWPLGLADAAHWLLAEYHEVFSLEPVDLGCTHSTKHTIKVMDDTPFKDWFRQIPLPLVGEVQNHLREMLSKCMVYCNSIGQEERWRLTILYWPLLPKCMHKKGLLPPAEDSGGMGDQVGTGHFLCLNLKWGFWQIKREEALKQYTAFTVGSLGVLQMWPHPFGLCNMLAMFQRLMQTCLSKLNLIDSLIYLEDIIIFL